MGWIKILMVYSCFSLPTCMFYCVFCYSLLHCLIISVASSNATEWLYFLSSLSCCQRLKEETSIWFLPFVFIYIICRVWFTSQWSFMVVCKNWNNSIVIISNVQFCHTAVRMHGYWITAVIEYVHLYVLIRYVHIYVYVCIYLYGIAKSYALLYIHAYTCVFELVMFMCLRSHAYY